MGTVRWFPWRRENQLVASALYDAARSPEWHLAITLLLSRQDGGGARPSNPLTPKKKKEYMAINRTALHFFFSTFFLAEKLFGKFPYSLDYEFFACPLVSLRLFCVSEKKRRDRRYILRKKKKRRDCKSLTAAHSQIER